MENNISVRIRETSGTYVTSRVGGKQASCSSSPRQAAEALAGKLGLSVIVDIKYVTPGVYEAHLREEDRGSS